MKVHAGKALRMLPCVSEDTAHRNKGFTLIECAFYKGGVGGVFVFVFCSLIRLWASKTHYICITNRTNKTTKD